MKNITNLFLTSISNAALFVTALSLTQCCCGKTYQPDVDTELKERAFRLTEEKKHERRQAGGDII